MAAGKGNVERLHRGFRTVVFILTLIVSLLMSSAPVIVAFMDVSVPCLLISTFTCMRCYTFTGHLRKYSFRSSLVDIPLASIVRSLVITCVYSLSDGPWLSNGPYLGTTAICSFVSVVILSVKAFLYAATSERDVESSLPASQKLLLNKSWGMPVLFLSSVVFALGHVVVAYRTSCRARRKLLFYRVDPEAVLCRKNMFSGGFQKVPRSPTPCANRIQRSDSESKRRHIQHAYDELDLPVRLLADVDSLFLSCQGLTLHYKCSLPDSVTSPFLGSVAFPQSESPCTSKCISMGRLKLDRILFTDSSRHQQYHLHRSFSNHVQSSSSLCTPLLANSASFVSEEISTLTPDDCSKETGVTLSENLVVVEGSKKFGVVLVHGFGGGVFSWRHVMGVLAQQVGCPVTAFDRPGWGLTSRLRRSEWEEKQAPNPYTLESQVDLVLAFFLKMGFTSVVLVGHDDGGLLVLKAVEKLRASPVPSPVEVLGVVLLNVNLSREVIPGFARILLHTSLGKKHIVRPLLRTEIAQVVNRRAWFNATRLTTEVLNLYKAPFYVEGWDEALQEISKLSYTTVLCPQDAAALLKSVNDVPVLVVAGAEDSLVPLTSSQALALKLANSTLVAVSGCGHLPHEECPETLLSVLCPFITRLLTVPKEHDLQKR